MKKILLIEDDENIANHLSTFLCEQSFSIHKASSKDKILEALNSNINFDLIILDRLINDFDTIELIPVFKKIWPKILILILSTINTPDERVNTINAGADDYLGKPFISQEVLARINALLRRTQSDENKIGNTTLNDTNQTITSPTASEALTQKEYQLMKTLTKNVGQIWNRTDLLKEVWDITADIDTNVVEMTITKLRKKLLSIDSSLTIRNSRHAGYWIET